MYSVKKENGKTFVYDWEGKVVWSAADGDYLLYRPASGVAKDTPMATQVGQLSDSQILVALASAIKLAI